MKKILSLLPRGSSSRRLFASLPAAKNSPAQPLKKGPLHPSAFINFAHDPKKIRSIFDGWKSKGMLTSQNVRDMALVHANHQQFEEGIRLFAEYTPKFPELAASERTFLVQTLARCSSLQQALNVKLLAESCGLKADWKHILFAALKHENPVAASLTIQALVTTSEFPRSSNDFYNFHRVITILVKKGEADAALHMLQLLPLSSSRNKMDIAFATRLDHLIAKVAPRKVHLLWNFFRVYFAPKAYAQILDSRILSLANNGRVQDALRCFKDHVGTPHRENALTGPTCGSLAQKLIADSRFPDAGMVLEWSAKWGVSDHPSCHYALATLYAVNGNHESAVSCLQSIPAQERPPLHAFFRDLSRSIRGDPLCSLFDFMAQKGILASLQKNQLMTITGALARSYISERKVEEGLKKLSTAPDPNVWIGILSALVHERRHDDFSRIYDVGVSSDILKPNYVDVLKLRAFDSLSRGDMQSAFSLAPNLHHFFSYLLKFEETDLALAFLQFLLESPDTALRSRALQAFLSSATCQDRADVASATLLSIADDGSQSVPLPLSFSDVARKIHDPSTILQLAEKFDRLGLDPKAARDFPSIVVDAAVFLGETQLATKLMGQYKAAGVNMSSTRLREGMDQHWDMMPESSVSSVENDSKTM